MVYLPLSAMCHLCLSLLHGGGGGRREEAITLPSLTIQVEPSSASSHLGGRGEPLLMSGHPLPLWGRWRREGRREGVCLLSSSGRRREEEWLACHSYLSCQWHILKWRQATYHLPVAWTASFSLLSGIMPSSLLPAWLMEGGRWQLGNGREEAPPLEVYSFSHIFHTHRCRWLGGEIATAACLLILLLLFMMFYIGRRGRRGSCYERRGEEGEGGGRGRASAI